MFHLSRDALIIGTCTLFLKLWFVLQVRAGFKKEGKPAHKMTPGDVYVVYKAKNPDVQQATVTVIYHDDTDDKNLPGGWTSGEQDEGTPVKYTQDDINKAIEGWKKKHYHYVRTDGTLPTTIPAQDTTVTVHLAHNMIPVNPNTPDKHGVNPDQLTETFTSTLHYQTKEGKRLAPDAVQSSNWIRQVTVDEVTNKVVPDGEYTTKWQLVGNDDRYNNFNVPVEIGYVAEKTTKDGAPVTNIVPGQIKVQRNLEDTVIYDKLADIIPVDPEGTPIPGVPKTPEKDNTPEPSEPTPDVPEPDEPEPDEPDVPTPRRHHKNKKHTSASKTMNNWSNNRSPYGENSNYKPIGETAPGNGESVLPNGEVVDHNGNVVGYVDANGKIHHTLPQTGESNNENVVAAVLGGTAVALGLIGLTGVKRRHTN